MTGKPLLIALILGGAIGFADAQAPTPAPRGVLGRMLHPFSHSEKIPDYRNKKLRGLLLALELPSQPVMLAEVRQLPVNITLTNKGPNAVELNFPTTQRFEILLRDAAGNILTRWSDNHAFDSTPGTLLINPGEHVEYADTIATRELAPNKVFTVEVFLPAYPELDTKRKSLTAP